MSCQDSPVAHLRQKDGILTEMGIGNLASNMALLKSIQTSTMRQRIFVRDNSPEEQEDRSRETLEIIVAVDLRLRFNFDVPKDLWRAR